MAGTLLEKQDGWAQRFLNVNDFTTNMDLALKCNLFSDWKEKEIPSYSLARYTKRKDLTMA